MKMYLRVSSVIGVVTCAMVSGSVLAADMPVSRESTVIPVPTYSWSGFYFGLHGGWGFGDFKNGKPGNQALHETCFPCHQPAKDRDYVFTRYAPTP